MSHGIRRNSTKPDLSDTIAYLQIRLWRASLLPGQIAGECRRLLLRMLGECFREPDAALILYVKFYSLFC